LIKLLPYILFEKCINILALEIASPGNRGTVPIVSAHFRSLLSAGPARRAACLDVGAYTEVGAQRGQASTVASIVNRD